MAAPFLVEGAARAGVPTPAARSASRRLRSTYMAELRQGRERLSRLRRDIEDVEHKSDHAVEAGAGHGFDDPLEPEGRLGALEHRGRDGFVGEQFGDEVIHQALIVALERRPLVGADASITSWVMPCSSACGSCTDHAYCAVALRTSSKIIS